MTNNTTCMVSMWWNHLSKVSNITMLIKILITKCSRVTIRYPPDVMSRIYFYSYQKKKQLYTSNPRSPWTSPEYNLRDRRPSQACRKRHKPKQFSVVYFSNGTTLFSLGCLLLYHYATLRPCSPPWLDSEYTFYWRETTIMFKRS